MAAAEAKFNMYISGDVIWRIDACSVYFDRMLVRGWAFHSGLVITKLRLVFDHSGREVPLQSYGLASPDVAAVFRGRSHAEAGRFDEWIEGSVDDLGTSFHLVFTLADGSEVIGPDGLTNAAMGDPYFQSWENFLLRLNDFRSGTVLEVGSRARSAVTRRHRIPSHLSYVGLDIMSGPNVDVVGDAHELASIFAGQRFVAVFSASVFEHLLMPWKVAVEINRVLEPGGLVYTSTHQTWPMHEEPWDFWRFSRHSWSALFNPATGFEVVEAVVGEPARVHPVRGSPVTRDMPASPAYLGSAALVRKIAETTLQWPVPVATATSTSYPAGQLDQPPTTDRS
jgi:SAM-dependent methyltransferase